jgi:cytosine/adenosine deaminase-related metal-dependent hydrolase
MKRRNAVAAVAIMVISCLLLVWGLIPRRSAGGIVLSFDDRSSIDSWGESFEFFEQHGIRATFFVDKIDALTPEQASALKRLAGAGNEIGSHGFRHQNAKDVMERGASLEDYLAGEILPSIEAMNELGFSCDSFAYPFGAFTEATDQAVSEYFRIIRKVNSSTAYYDGSSRPFVGAHYIDGPAIPHEKLERIIKKARDTGTVVSLSAHKVGPVGGNYWCAHETLESIAGLARKYKLPFLTMSELDTR